MIVRYTRRARGDLAKILNYLNARSPRGALNVRLAIKRTIDTIGKNILDGRGGRNLGVAHSSWRPAGMAWLNKVCCQDGFDAVASIFEFKSMPPWRKLPGGEPERALGSEKP
jgi:hypothetical protein